MSKNYILIYYQQIKDGSVTVGRWIEKWYEYIVHGLEAKRFFFDQKKAARAIAFVQQYCRHHEGPLAPQLITLEVWQKALVSVVFGVVDPDGLRQFRECFVVMGRKNGKTLLDAAIAAYMMYADGEYGGRAYFVASRLDQSRLAFEAFYQMVSKEPRLAAKTKKRRSDVYIAESNSSAMPQSRSFFAASSNAPTPGRMMRSAPRSFSASRVTTASSPMAAKEEAREKRFPTP